jgi:hypothetical protein
LMSRPFAPARIGPITEIENRGCGIPSGSINFDAGAAKVISSQKVMV